MSTNLITQTDTVVLPYTNVELTAAVNNLPPTFGRLAAAGLFPPEGLASAMVEIDIENGVISALPVTNDGKPSTIAKRDTGKALFFKVPNISHLDSIMAGEIRNMLMIFNRTKLPATLANLMNKRLSQRMRPKFDITLELMRMSSLKGQIIDGAGTVLYDLFTAFNITPQSVTFNFSSDTFDVRGACGQVIGLMEDNLSDEVMSGVKAYVDSAFMDKLTTHPKVEKFYANWQAAEEMSNPKRGEDGSYRPRTFMFGNLFFEEYRANVPMWGGGNQRIIDANTGHAFPMGTIDSHATYAAPPLDVRELDGSAASTDDLIHITTELLKHGEGQELKGQMNALPLWRRPKLLVKLVVT
jgi:hypothetical protein